MSGQRLAILLMLAQAALFSIETGMIHHIGPQGSIVLLAFLRSAGGLVLVAALAWKRDNGWGFMKSKNLPLQILRAIVSLGYLLVMICSFGKLPLAEATAISYTQAVYIAGFSALILNERVTPLRWTAAFIGLAGAVLLVCPGFSEWDFLYLVVILGTGLNGLAFVLNKLLQRPGADSELTTMFCVSAVGVVCTSPALTSAEIPALNTWPWLSGVLLFGPMGMYVGIVAVRHADASSLGPYTTARLLIAVGAGAVIFAEVPDGFGLLGMVLIGLGCAAAAIPGDRRNAARTTRPKVPDVISAGFRLAKAGPLRTLPQAIGRQSGTLIRF